jgi:hypothetical protein
MNTNFRSLRIASASIVTLLPPFFSGNTVVPPIVGNQP